MMIILDVIDKTKRELYLTEESYIHILKHPEMQFKLDNIRLALINPLRIITSEDRHVVYYYSHDKIKRKYLRVVVKYLNGKGFIITAYFVDNMK